MAVTPSPAAGPAAHGAGTPSAPPMQAPPPLARALRPGIGQGRSLNPLALLRSRLEVWWQTRLRASDTHALTQRNVYILPTRPGWMLALTLMVLLVASINYQLNLGYLLTFLLAGSAVVGMHVCHNNLRGAVLSLQPPEPHFASDSASFTVQLRNDRNTPRIGLGLAVLGGDHWAWTDVPAQGSSPVALSFRPPRRGLQPLPLLTVETRFPLGTFRVWTVWRPASPMLVYPAPERRAPPLPPGEPRSGGAPAARQGTTGEFDGVRGYRRGDPTRLVVWKKSGPAIETGAGSLVVRDTQQAQRHELWLDFDQCGIGGTEARLSRLCAWVLAADRAGLDYGLRLPGTRIAPASGPAHRRQCLEALALC